jgi:hypothetical protein
VRFHGVDELTAAGAARIAIGLPRVRSILRHRRKGAQPVLRAAQVALNWVYARGRCDRSERFRQLGGMSTATATDASARQDLRGGALAEFEEIYRSNVGLVAAYFARRSGSRRRLRT